MIRLGVVDVGTNSVRLLVADADLSGPAPVLGRDVARDLVITRLGQAVDRDRRLAPEALRRTVAAVSGYVEQARAAGAATVRIIATSAVRDAANREEFLDAVRRATDEQPEVLSGDEEARLGFRGATVKIDPPGPYLVVDIGGGSTEFVYGETSVDAAVSMDIGSVRMTERHIRSDPPTDAEIDAVRDDAAREVLSAITVLGEIAPRTLVGLAGTITTAAALALALERYDRAVVHHTRLSRRQIAEVRRRLCAMTSEERRRLPTMPSGREDVIVAGLLILEEVLAAFACPDCLVSESDILDGAALDAAERLAPPLRADRDQ